MSSYYLEQADTGPLCPYSGAMQNERHRQWVAVQDAAYAQTVHLRDADGEYDDAGQAEYARLIREGALRFDITVPDRPLARYELEQMYLYQVTATVGYQAQTSRGVQIQTFYFQCPVCGFVLPAGQAAP